RDWSARYADEFLGKWKSVASPADAPAWAAALADPSPDVRAATVEVILRYGGDCPVTAPALLLALADPDHVVRATAAELAGPLAAGPVGRGGRLAPPAWPAGPAAGVSPLTAGLMPLAADPDPGVREAAVFALGYKAAPNPAVAAAVRPCLVDRDRD